MGHMMTLMAMMVVLMRDIGDGDDDDDDDDDDEDDDDDDDGDADNDHDRDCGDDELPSLYPYWSGN